MAATVEKHTDIAKQEAHGIGNLLRTVHDDLKSRAMNHTSDSSSNNLIASHPAVYLAVEGAKEILNIVRGMSKRK